MSQKKIMLTSFICSVFFILVMSIPLTLYAGPPDKEAKCPCFSQREVMRAISKSFDGTVHWIYVVDNNGDGQISLQVFYSDTDDEVFNAARNNGVGECFETYRTAKGKSGRCVEQYLQGSSAEGDACLDILDSFRSGCGVDYECLGDAEAVRCP